MLLAWDSGGDLDLHVVVAPGVALGVDVTTAGYGPEIYSSAAPLKGAYLYSSTITAAAAAAAGELTLVMA